MKEVTLIDADGKFGRMEFRKLLSVSEWQDMRDLAQTAIGEDFVRLVEILPRFQTHQGDAIGWWHPRAFQLKHCVCSIPDDLAEKPESFGWETALAVSSFKPAFLQLCDLHPDLSELGQARRSTRQLNESHKFTTKLEDPFEGISNVRKMLSPGSKIEKENDDILVGMTATVVYNPIQDAYLDFQMSWRQLNRAKIFPTPQEAEDIIKQRKLAGCTTATVSMRVEAFSNPNLMGPKAERALRKRIAMETEQQLQQVVEKVQGTPTTPRRRF